MEELELCADPEAMRLLSHELATILSESDRLLIALLVEQPVKNNHNENQFDDDQEGSQQLIMVASELRAKLKKCMECAGAMYDSNVLCFSTILRLRKELSDTNTKHKHQIDAVQHRMESLLNVVETQSKDLQETESTFRLKGLWNKLLSQASNNQLNQLYATSYNSNDECAIAMSVLTALCAKEMQTQNTANDDELGALGDSLIQNLLNKVNEVKGLTENEMRRVEDENNCLRLAIGEKGALIELISEREAGLLEELDTTKKQMNDIKALIMEYEARAIHAEEEAFKMKSEIALISEKLNNTQQAYSLMTCQYQEVTQHWNGDGNTRATLNDINAKVLEATQQIRKLTPDKSKYIADSLVNVPSFFIQQQVPTYDAEANSRNNKPPATNLTAAPTRCQTKSNSKLQQRPPWVTKLSTSSTKKRIPPRGNAVNTRTAVTTKRWEPEWYRSNNLLNKQSSYRANASDSPNENRVQNTFSPQDNSLVDTKIDKHEGASNAQSHSFSSEVAEAMNIINSLKSTWVEDE